MFIVLKILNNKNRLWLSHHLPKLLKIGKMKKIYLTSIRYKCKMGYLIYQSWFLISKSVYENTLRQGDLVMLESYYVDILPGNRYYALRWSLEASFFLVSKLSFLAPVTAGSTSWTLRSLCSAFCVPRLILSEAYILAVKRVQSILELKILMYVVQCPSWRC